MSRLLIILSVTALLVFYIRRRLVVDTGLTGWRNIVLTLWIAALPMPLILVNLLQPAGPPKVTGPMAWPTYLGQALIMLAFVALLAIDVGRLVSWAARKALRSAPLDPARRQALARITGGVASAAVVGHVAYGVTRALGDAEVVEVPVTLAKLPPALDGFTIVQLTDIHVGGTIQRAFVEELVARTLALKPDLIALTGDLVDGSVAELAAHVAPFAKLSAPHGVFFITGNHEYYSGADAWIAKWRSLGIRVLRNERVEVGRAGAVFDLAGVDDHGAHRYTGHGMDLTKALTGRDASRALVLLAHQPRQVREAANHGVDLQLSGHTHGGQVWPWHHIVSLQQGGLLAGRYQIGDTQLYVSRGAGYWGPPVRVGAPPEITRVILRSTPAGADRAARDPEPR